MSACLHVSYFLFYPAVLGHFLYFFTLLLLSSFCASFYEDNVLGRGPNTPPFTESVFKIDYFWGGFEQAINNNADYNKPEDDRAKQYLSPMSTSRGIRNQWPTQSINTLRLKVTGQWGEAIALTGGNVRQLKEPINFQPLRAVNSSVPAEDVMWCGGQRRFQVERVPLIVLL